jgi:hypothetical protein
LKHNNNLCVPPHPKKPVAKCSSLLFWTKAREPLPADHDCCCHNCCCKFTFATAAEEEQEEQEEEQEEERTALVVV